MATNGIAVEGAVLRELHAAPRVEPLTVAPPRTGEVVVEMKAAGVCHSDWHIVTGDMEVDLPVVLGHEGSGVVAELGPDVDGLAIGDHVTLSWIPHCGDCRACRAGRTNLCRTYLPPLWAGTMLDGTRRITDADADPVHHLSALSTWSTAAVVPAISCVRMPAVPYEISAMIGCAVTTGVGAALNAAQVTEGSTVAVFGAGGVGLSIVMGAALAGAERIVVVDVNPAKEELAHSLGATDVVIAGGQAGDDPVAAILDLTDGVGVEFAFDAVGRTDIETRLLDAVAQFGTGVLVGMPPAGATFTADPAALIRDEKVLTGTIFGSAHTHRDFVRYAELYLDGRLPLDRLVTGRYPLARIADACDEMLTGDGGRSVVVY